MTANMATSSSASSAGVAEDPALAAPWKAYRMWACTARDHRDAIDRLTSRSLGLGIGGAVTVVLGQQIGPLVGVPVLVKAAGCLGAATIGLAAYFGKQAQAEDREDRWIRCRSAAETLKSGIFLYRASAPPFDGPDRAAQIGSRIDSVLDQMKGVEPRQPGPEEAKPLGPLTVDEYLVDRVRDQINFYERRAGEYQAKIDSYRQVTFWLMAISALLALASTVSALSIWAPVVATVTASLTAFLKNRRYQAIKTTYQTTALRLERLAGEWAQSGKRDKDTVERSLLIQRCEETMSNENGAWVALWSKKSAAAAGLASTTATPSAPPPP